MARWIAVTIRRTNEEAFVNLDNVDMIVGNSILFNGIDGDDGMECKETHTELVARVALAEGERRYMTPETRERAERIKI